MTLAQVIDKLQQAATSLGPGAVEVPVEFVAKCEDCGVNQTFIDMLSAERLIDFQSTAHRIRIVISK